LVGFGHTWGEHRVFFREPGQTRVRSLPAIWTDLGGADPFLVISAGRALFRPEDLLKLVRLLAELQEPRRKSDSAVDVRRITPGIAERSSSSRLRLPVG
jgi:uncharacterized protein DUF5372